MLSIYNYNDPIQYISDFLTAQKEVNSQFSMRKWAKDAGFESHGRLIEILKKEKNLKNQNVEAIVDKIGLDKSEYSYFFALVAKSKATAGYEQNIYSLFLNDLRPTKKEEVSIVRFEQSDLFSHWIFVAILTMAKLKDFTLTADNIQQSLKEEVPLEIIHGALDYLVETGMFKCEDGEYQRVIGSVSTVTDKSPVSVKNYYSQIADLSKKATEVSPEEREFQSFAVTVSPEKLPLIKEAIRKCRANIGAICDEAGDEVYQMQMSFFPLTQRKDLDKENKAAIRA